ncbi:MAG: hypothetical protein Q8L77_13915 [Nitrospirota bacterium]|nr:hypothetical protein [Nitrospirota bacterium]
MTNEEKGKCVRRWIVHEERVTVHFLDALCLSATGTKSTGQFVELSIETRVPA